MVLLTGIILLALGLSLCVAFWSQAFAAALLVLIVFSLLFWGAIFTLVGYSAAKARREFEEAINNEPDEGNSDNSTAPSASEIPSG